MTLDIRRDAIILNIFRDDVKHVADFITHHAPLASKVIMLDTGATDGSAEGAAETARNFDNVFIFRNAFAEVNFSAFRNCLLELAAPLVEDASYFIWVDTDERLRQHQVALPEAEAWSIRRADSSGLFFTWLTRGFSTELAGRWVGHVHEGFLPDHHVSVVEVNALTIDHLESEMERPLHKKRLYFELLLKSLDNPELTRGNRSELASHAITMASFDLDDPQLCSDLFDRYVEDILASEQFSVTEVNALIHAVRSKSRLEQACLPLARLVLEVDAAKSTTYQVLRGLLLNIHNTVWVRDFYTSTYHDLPDVRRVDLYNGDFREPRQVELFERRVERQLNLLRAGFDNA
jgi:hypothetical protein